MSKSKNLFIILLFVFFTILTTFLGGNAFASASDSKTGMSFNSSNQYKMASVIQNPQTFEAWIKLDSSVTGRGGVILGNFVNEGTKALSFEIHDNGAPRLYYSNESSSSATFKSVDVRTGKWTHIAITWSLNVARCYLNGILKSSITLNRTDYKSANPFVLGGDYRTNNECYFKGQINSVAIFSDVRSQEEIVADMKNIQTPDETLQAYYKLEGLDWPTKIYDSSGYYNDLTTKWIKTGVPVEDYDYSFMAIGDIQILTENQPDKLSNIYDYVVDNVEEKKVKHVFGLGDITNKDTIDEWIAASNEIRKLDGVVPYSLVRGNHDLYCVKDPIKNETYYDKFFGSKSSPYYKQYKDSFTEYGDFSRARNTVHEFSAGNLDYLVVTLDFGADDNVLAWANQVIENHPYHNVIITTHAYLSSNGTTLDSTENCPPTRDYPNANNGDHLWNELVKLHENIVMVICGHDPSEQLTLLQTPGNNGNIVSQLLIDAQAMDLFMGGTGMVATLYFSDNGETVTIEWYSTIKELYFREANQYSFKVATVARQAKLNVEVEGKGEVTPNNIIFDDNPVEVSLLPEENYYLSKLELNGVDITKSVVNGKYLLTDTSKYCLLKATFLEKAKYSLSLINDESKGIIILSDSSLSYYKDSQLTLRIQEKEGYEIKKVLFNNTELESGYDQYTIIIQEGANTFEVIYDKYNESSVHNDSINLSKIMAFMAFLMTFGCGSYLLIYQYLLKRKKSKTENDDKNS